MSTDGSGLISSQQDRPALSPFRSVCVFCGSNGGYRPAYFEAARQLGYLIGNLGMTLIYGGGSLGMMGEAAAAALVAGARVIGVIPRDLIAREQAQQSACELRVVGSLHERKGVMAELAGAFLALPGGMGTLDELSEIWTWTQLGLNHKPIGILNTNGYFDMLLSYLDHTVDEGFLSRSDRNLIAVDFDPQRLLETMAERALASRPASGCNTEQLATNP